MERETIDLTGVWRCQPDRFLEGEDDGYHAADYEMRQWREVDVPSIFERCITDKDQYEGVLWYRRNFEVPGSWTGRRVLVRFEGVNDTCRVWVNGKSVGENEDGCLRFEFPVDGVLRCGDRNCIAVRVDNTRRPGEVPGLQRGWIASGGILREVSLIAADRLHIENVRIVAEPASGGGTLRLWAEVVNGRDEPVRATIAAVVRDGSGAEMARCEGEPVQMQAGEDGVLELATDVPGARPWLPAEPNLYTASVVLSDGQGGDGLEARFGFRRVEVKDCRLLLNGEPIFLTGFDRHEDSPRSGFASDLELTRRDYEQMKEAGANFVRLCHYPHHPGELDICDELGILALGEIPLAFWPGLEDGAEHFVPKMRAARRQLRKMIRRDWNHPSIIFWSVSNETREQNPEVAAVNAQLVLLAQKLDPTRLVGHVSNRFAKCPYYECDDVVFVNSYPWMTREKGMREFSGNTEYWRQALAELHEQFPEKPILVTEFGHWAFEGVFGNGTGEDLQALSIEAGFRGMQAPYVCGASIWCWADHTTRGFSYAVSTRERRKLAGFYAARRMFRERQGLPLDAPAPQADAPGGARVTMVRERLDDVPVVEFPSGFGVRPMQPGEGALWEDILREALSERTVERGMFEQVFGSNLPATEWRCFFVVNEAGAAVGTVAAWYDRDFKGQDHGCVHWLVIRPDWQGKGLGRAALSHALRRM
ncbi:MAG: GNAT family N-acetyltransferase, partial [Planctomycetota bacterium]